MRHKRPRSNVNKESTTLTLGKLHPNIVCRLCRGYIVDCVTIVECMHSFCKSCIVKYLNEQEERYECPKCGQIIHDTNPWNYLAPDSALQTIIYKLVPGLQESEMRKCTEFYKRRGISPPRKEQESLLEKDTSNNKESHRVKSKTADQKNGGSDEATTKPADNDNHRMDEQISIQLMSLRSSKNRTDDNEDCNDAQSDEFLAQKTADGKILRPFLRLSCFATVNLIRKYLAYRLHGNIDRYAEFELFCEGRPLYKEHTLKFIAATVWGHIADQSETKSDDLVMPIVYRCRNTAAAVDDGTDEDDTGNDDKNVAMSDSITNNNSNSASSPV